MPAETSLVAELAGRYAAALFDLAREKKALDEVAGDLARLQAMLSESADLRRLVRSPVIARDDKARAMAALMEAAEIGGLTRRFVGVVARHQRLYALDDMIRSFSALLSEHRGEMTADVASARPLGEAELGALESELGRIAGCKVNVAATVDDGLIGGLVVRLGSRMVDSSLRTKLDKLRFAMKGVA